jgi:uncharacterized protein (AIM24 family)
MINFRMSRSSRGGVLRALVASVGVATLLVNEARGQGALVLLGAVGSAAAFTCW